MAKPNPAVKDFNKARISASMLVTDRAEHVDKLRDVLREAFSVLLVEAVDETSRAQQQGALNLLAACFNVSARFVSVFSQLNFNDLRVSNLISSLDDETTRSVRSLYSNPQRSIATSALADNHGQALAVLDAHLSGMLKGPMFGQIVPEYTTPPVSKVFPEFWSDMFGTITRGVYTNMVAGETALTTQQVNIEDLASNFALGLAQIVTCRGLTDLLSKDFNPYAYSDIDVYVMVTDGDRNVSVYRVRLLKSLIGPLMSVGRAILGMGEDIDPDDLDADEDDLTPIRTHFMDMEPVAEPAHTMELCGVHTLQQESFPVFVDFECVDFPEATHDLFPQVPHDLTIGFALVMTKQRQSLRVPSIRDSAEIGAAILDVVCLPDVEKKVLAKAAKPVKPCRHKSASQSRSRHRP